MVTIKEFYTKAYPTDELGTELLDNTYFTGLINVLHLRGNVYEYIGVGDSIIRERLFTELSRQLNKPYDYVYELWFNSYA